ncbi:RcpC/CpaB family pilus assembly protein [Bacteroides heparinolyticus]|uniref:RcpC/CpaB family pilus assembly protein n=1 Tax=Prevotella heparinolytica TaxID=28113 RepID=UPI00359F54B6
MRIFRSRIFIGVVSLVFAGLLSFIIAPMLEESKTAVGVAFRYKDDLRKGATLTEENLERIEIGYYGQSDDIKIESSDVLGKTLAYDVRKGEFATKRAVSEGGGPDEYLSELLNSESAIGITVVNQARAVADKLRSGDIVTVITTKEAENEIRATVAIELEAVEVLAVTTKERTDVETGEIEEISVVLLKTQHESQVSRLAEAEAMGTAHLALVYRGDDAARKNALLQNQLRKIALVYGELSNGGSDTPSETIMER